MEVIYNGSFHGAAGIDADKRASYCCTARTLEPFCAGTDAGGAYSHPTPDLQPEELETELYILDNFFMEGVMEHLDAEMRALFLVAEQLEPNELPLTTTLRKENTRLRALTTTFLTAGQVPGKRPCGEIMGVGNLLLCIIHAHLLEEEALLFPFLDARLNERDVEGYWYVRCWTIFLIPTWCAVMSSHLGRCAFSGPHEPDTVRLRAREQERKRNCQTWVNFPHHLGPSAFLGIIQIAMYEA